MSYEEKLLLLKQWLECHRALDEQHEALHKVLDIAPEAPLPTAYFKMFDAYTATLAKLIGDQGDWLQWFIWENGAGKKGFTAGPAEATRPIRTIEDLLWLMTPAP